MSGEAHRVSRRRLFGIVGGAALSALASRMGQSRLAQAIDVGPLQSEPPAGSDEFAQHVGWAYTIDWMITPEEMRSDMRRMRDEGCTSVYIGHDNPASPGWGSAEPGLSFAVWHELEVDGPRAWEARTKLDHIHAALEAADLAGLKVVLPIDYQIQNGHAWSDAHPGHLALGPDGGVLRSAADPIASPYSPLFREHKRQYYEWARDEVLARYSHIIAINLGDEPLACDYSSHAMAAFDERYGVPFDAASDAERGEFQSGVVADYALWSAWEWEELVPGIRTMFTFHIDRYRPFYPDFDRVFHAAPPAFIISADTHLHDAPLWEPLTGQDRNLLFDLCRRLGFWSCVSDRDLMLWHSVNSWGLNSGGIPEALDNHDVILTATREAGGRIGKTMAWARNIRFQGLYRHEGAFDHVDPDEMVAAIAPRMADSRATLSDQGEPLPHQVVYLPSRLAHEAIGRDRPRFSWQHDALADPGALDFATTRRVTMTDGPALEEARRMGWQIVRLDSLTDHVVALPRLYYLPTDVREVEAGSVWFGISTHAALETVGVAARQSGLLGLDWLREAGLYKGSLYFAGPDGAFYERVVFERAVMHAVSGRFETTLVLRDLASGTVELGEGNRLFAPLVQDALDRVASSPIIGDEGSLAPALPALRPYLTLYGDNPDLDRVGQPAADAIDRDGNIVPAPDELTTHATFALYDNGHNVPDRLLEEITGRYGPTFADWWPRVGRPIGRAFWMQSVIGAEGLQWVLTQPFERAMLTYHPAYVGTPGWTVQGALVGNLFVRAVTGSSDPYRPEFHDMRW